MHHEGGRRPHRDRVRGVATRGVILALALGAFAAAPEDPALKQAREAAAALADPNAPTPMPAPKPGSMADRMLTWLRDNLFDPLFGQIDGSAHKAARALASPDTDVPEPEEVKLPNFALPGAKQALSDPGPVRESEKPAPETRKDGLSLIKERKLRPKQPRRLKLRAQ